MVQDSFYDGSIDQHTGPRLRRRRGEPNGTYGLETTRDRFRVVADTF